MTAIRPIHARLRTSRVSYICDVTKEDGAEIPLGLIADVRIGQVYALGLITRQRLSDQETSMVGRLVREIVRQPFVFLQGEFKQVWGPEDRAPDQRQLEFSRLPEKHCQALQFSDFEESPIRLPLHLAARSKDLEAIRSWARATLRAERDKAYWAFLDEHLLGVEDSGGLQQRGWLLAA